MPRPITTGAMQFWKKGVVPAGKEMILDVVDQVIADFVDDMGGEAEISAGQNILLHNLKKMLTFELLVDEYLSQHGIIDEKGNVSPSLSSFYLAVCNGASRIVEKLGMKRIKGTESWTKYLASREAALAAGQGSLIEGEAGTEIEPLRGSK